MELLIAERLKKYRKERNMTQEALAEVFGISPQSVSKWECGDGYPDITFLPTIANYFEVTVDELIGNDEISAKEDVQKNYFNVLNRCSHDERLALGLKYHKKYPRNWHVATSLMNIINLYHRDKLEEYKPLLREIAERILRECSDSNSRRRAVHQMCLICPEDEIENWFRRDTEFWHEEKLDTLEKRYQLMGDEEQRWIYRYAGNFLRAAHTIDRLTHHPKHKNPHEALAWYTMYVQMLDGLTGRREDNDIPDGWICEYGFAYRALASVHFCLAEKDTGYAYLERALILAERWAKIPREAPLALGNPLFFGETRILKDKAGLVLPNGKRYPHLLGIRYCLHDLSAIMTQPTGWPGFDRVREEERWTALLERAKAFSAKGN